jgi:Cd2+/Zn2+-exporting ATPase
MSLSSSCGSHCQCSQPTKLTTKTASQPWHKQGPLLTFASSALLTAIGMGLSQSPFPQLSVFLYAMASLAGARPLAKTWITNSKERNYLTIETLMLLACAGAFFIGEAAEAAAVVSLYALGQLIEDYAGSRSRESIQALHALQPQTATLLVGNEKKNVPASELIPEQIIFVLAGERIPADGEILDGQSFVDESHFTGESIPVRKNMGLSVYAGTVAMDGTLTIRVTKKHEENRLAQIIHLIESSSSSKVRLARTIQRFAAYYTPAIFFLAIFTAFVPPILEFGDFTTWLYRGLSLLLIGCPCALILSTPTSTAAAIALAARNGLLVKGGVPLETMGRITVIALDKTGTLTTGHPHVQSIVATENHTEHSALALAASLEAHSSHPYAQALKAEAQKLNLQFADAKHVRTIPGIGIEGVVEDLPVSIVSAHHAEAHHTLPHSLKNSLQQSRESGYSSLVVIKNSVPLALISLSDTLRKDAELAMSEFQKLKIPCVLLTGDGEAAAKFISQKLGISYHASLLPEQKQHHIDRLKAKHVVAMVGDGINDAPALARAHVSLAMGSGTDLASETADITLVGNSLVSVAHLIHISQKTMCNIRQNIAIALLLKCGFLVTSILGITTLWMAVLADTGAAVLVTLNALRVLRIKL